MFASKQVIRYLSAGLQSFLFVSFLTPNVASEALSDCITNIETSPTQIVLITDKQGTSSKQSPPDKLRIHIEVTDLEDGRKMPPVDLSGLWITISRGRYTIPFLKPDHLYGVSFRSENIIDNKPVMHTEDRLVRTPPRPPMALYGIPNNQTAAQPPAPQPSCEVQVHRSLEGEENHEGIYITAKWTTKNRLNNSECLTDVVVHCATSNNKERIPLKADEDAVTIEITMDHRYDLEEVNSTLHQYKALITPLKCKKICWTSIYEVHSAGATFSELQGDSCQDIHGTTTTAYLRHIKKYTVKENNLAKMELVVETELNDRHEDGFVTLTALKLGSSNETAVYKTFSTMNSDGTFRLTLDDDAVYAVQYEYTKVKPFHYTAKEHFLAEVKGLNSSRPSVTPVELRFEPKSLAKDPNVKSPDHPTISLYRGTHFTSYPIRILLEPFCGHQNQSIILDSAYQHHDVDASPLLCGIKPQAYFCHHEASKEASGASGASGAASNHTRPTCNSSILCYSTQIQVSGEIYPSDTRCINVTQHYDLATASGSSIFALTSIFSYSLLLYVTSF